MDTLRLIPLVRRAACGRLRRWLLLLAPLLMSGCASWPGAFPPPEEKPRTVSEWLKQPRVGEDMRRT